MSDKDKSTLVNMRQEAVENHKTYRCEYGVKSQSGNERYLEEYGEPLMVSGAVKVSAAVLDVTERKAMERIKDEFISMVSHELRTPLTSIAGSLGLLQGGLAGSFSDKAATLLETASRNSKRLVGLVNDILDVNMLEFGGIPLTLVEIDVSEMVKSSLIDNQGYAENFQLNWN